MPKRTITAEDAPYFLEKLSCEDIKAQQEGLRELCPCRSRCYDPEIWTAICRAQDSPFSAKEVVDQAFHALETLVEVAEKSAEARALLDHLVEAHVVTLPLEKPGGPPTDRQGNRIPAKKREWKVRSRDIPRLIETLTYG